MSAKELGWLDVEITNIGLRETATGKVLALTFQPLDYSTKYFIGMGPRSPMWRELVNAAFSHTEIVTMGLEHEDIWDVGLLMFEKRVSGLLVHSNNLIYNYADQNLERYWFKHFRPLVRALDG